jgi:hypothetical protein
MALKPCRECGSDVSTQAEKCPSCGAPYPGQDVWKGFYGIHWKSRTTVFSIPLVHVALCLDEKRRPVTAKGIVAVGQFAIGVITIAQFGVGILFGLGQFVLGLVAVAQFAIAAFIGIGQMASGVLAVGQMVVGIYGYCQDGWAKYIWSSTRVDMEAVAMFYTIADRIQRLVAF